MIALAKYLNEFREERYMTVDEFVSHLGITIGTFYRIMKGKRPRPTTMRRIAEKLEVHPSDIEEFVHKPPSSSDQG